jgi:hypothetical protein
VEALDLSYQLSVSYEVSVVPIDSSRATDKVVPVDVVMPGVRRRGADVIARG